MLEKSYRVLNLKSGEELIIDFADPKYELLTTFLCSDVAAFGEKVKRRFDEVLSGKTERIETSGNVCYIEITPETTKVFDGLTPDEEEYERTACEVDTKELRELIEEWCEELRKFREARKEKE